MKNKLAYLGFLGLLGFAGFWGTPLMFSFFANFVFFIYIKVVPDELFWANVRVSATRGFFVYTAASKIIIVTAILLAVNNMRDLAISFAVGAFAMTLVFGDLAFLISMIYFDAKEKRSLEDDEDN